MALVALGVDGAAHRLPSTASTIGRGVPMSVSACAHSVVVAVDRFGALRGRGPIRQPCADHGVYRCGVDIGEHPPDRCFEGGAGNARTRPQRAYTDTRRSAGVPLTHPAIAVHECIPVTTAPAHNVSTTDTGWCTHRMSRYRRDPQTPGHPPLVVDLETTVLVRTTSPRAAPAPSSGVVIFQMTPAPSGVRQFQCTIGLLMGWRQEGSMVG